ncbi:MAG: Lrp/AsnC family transcriptional regulator, partial [Actinomycetota bacterium]|nr:Lrp/AsnC family transcriptional regulator [Actinomycetota bacterium]MDP9021578.1 Lrp/AsnC family transcriptional regulator [Actinomycetota bacterium]
AARSMGHLEEITADLARFGSIATSVVYSSPILHRELTDLL